MKKVMKKLLSGCMALSMAVGLFLANPVSAAETVPVFEDVAPTAYYAEAVTWAVENGITSGTSATTFSPNHVCTTAEILTFLYRAAGSPEVIGEQPFSDVSADAYYYDAAAWAHEKGIVTGDVFNGSAPCTRSATVTYMWLFKGKPVPEEETTFNDVASNAGYAKAVSWAVEHGITAGTSDTTFAPEATCTRGQIVTFLYRLKDVPAQPERAVAEMDMAALEPFGEDAKFYSNRTFTCRQQEIRATNLFIGTNHNWAQHNATYLLDGKYNEFKASVAVYDENDKFSVLLMDLDTNEVIPILNQSTGEYVDRVEVKAGDKPVSITADVSGVDKFMISVSTKGTWIGSAGNPWYYKTAGALYDAVLTYYE